MIAVEDIPLTEETAPQLITDLGRSRSGKLRHLLSKLVSQAQVQTALTALNQRRINYANERIETRMVEGIGERVARLDYGVWSQMRELHGRNCWADPEFIKAFLRDNPECRLKLHTRQYWNGFTSE